MKKVRVFELPLVLHRAQQAIDDSTARFKVVLAGRRFGKTQYGLYWLLKHASVPGTINWAVAPTYRQAKEVLWRSLLNMIPQALVRAINNTDLSVELVNKSIIALKGSEAQNTLRGVKLHAVLMEEAAFHQHSTWPDIIRPALADLKGEALFITTPKGRNWLYKLWELGNSMTEPDWRSFHFTINDNPYIAKDEIKTIKAEVSTTTWRQEFMAEVLANVGQVYGEFSDANIYRQGEEYLGYDRWPMVRAVDWGMEDNTSCVWLHIHPSTGQIVATHEHVQNGWSVNRHAEVIKRVTASRTATPGNDVLDQSAFKEEATSSTSIGKQFAKEGLYFAKSDRDMGVSMDVFKRFITGFNDMPGLRISSSCRHLIEGLRSFEYDQHEPDVVAACRYGAMHIYRKRLSSFLVGNESVESSRQDEIGELPPGESPLTREGRMRIRSREAREFSWDFDAGGFA